MSTKLRDAKPAIGSTFHLRSQYHQRFTFSILADLFGPFFFFFFLVPVINCLQNMISVYLCQGQAAYHIKKKPSLTIGLWSTRESSQRILRIFIYRLSWQLNNTHFIHVTPMSIIQNGFQRKIIISRRLRFQFEIS